MVECPWCGNEFEVVENICPYCKHEVLPEHVSVIDEAANDGLGDDEVKLGIVDQLIGMDDAGWPHEFVDPKDIVASRFKCSQCGHEQCETNEAAMNGTGISKLLDIEYIHYIFASCLSCGFVEVYNPDIIRRQAAAQRDRG